MNNYVPVFGYKTKNYKQATVYMSGILQVATIKIPFSNNKLRILLTNKYNPKSLSVKEMIVTIKNVNYTLTLNNKKSFVLKPNSEVYSDELLINENKYDEIVVSVRFGDSSKLYGGADFNSKVQASINHYGILGNQIFLKDRMKAIYMPDLQVMFLIKQIEIISNKAKSLVFFGDSLINQSHYTQPLQMKIIEKGCEVSILNAGHSGNKLLKDGELLDDDIFGIAAINRFKEDVFEYNKPEVVIISIGINDLINSAANISPETLPKLEEIIAGYLKILKIAKENNAKVVITTITPFNGYKDNILPEADIRREEINIWIRNQNKFDMVFDLDRIVRDKNDNSSLAKDFRGIDNLHFLSAGGQIIADNIDLDVLLSLIEN